MVLEFQEVIHGQRKSAGLAKELQIPFIIPSFDLGRGPMKKLFSLALLLILTSSFTFTQSPEFKPGGEPDGFRQIKWDTPITALSDMRLVWDDGDRKLYEREHDSLEMAGAKIHRIVYTFWRGRFSEVRVDILKAYDNPQDEFAHFKRVRNICFDRFGSRKKGVFGSEEYSWLGKTTWVRLVRDDPGLLQLTMGSSKLLHLKRSCEEGETRQVSAQIKNEF
jgi:hypothetical protein